MTDRITKKFFDIRLWKEAIAKGVDKGIDDALLRTLSDPKVRLSLYRTVCDGTYDISAPRAVRIPKGSGEFRTVFVNEPEDRILLSIANSVLFEIAGDMIHPSCKAYIPDVSCGRVAREASHALRNQKPGAEVLGWKADLSKYFDSVRIEHIDRAFDRLESRYGRSAVIDMIRRYYHNDRYVETDGTIATDYKSLRQGCAVSSWLSNVVLNHIDERLSSMGDFYIRYCDDLLFIGPDHREAMEVLTEGLEEMGLAVNSKKTEYITDSKWFNFLGFALRGNRISLSEGRIKKFQQLVKSACSGCSSRGDASKKLMRALYNGSESHSWATQVLPYMNCDADIDTLNNYVMDSIRAAATGKRRIGGLGFLKRGENGCIMRGKGRHVRNNRINGLKNIEWYLSIKCMQNALHTSRAAFDSLLNSTLAAHTAFRD